MKQKVAILLMFLSTGVVINSCNKSSDTVNGPPSTPAENLLANSSFESNGNPSLLGWRCIDSSLVQFTHDTPNDGGTWAIQLETGWIHFPLYVSQTVAAPTGTHRYQISSWAKAFGASGKFSLTFKRNDTLTLRKTLYVVDPGWTSRFFLDTLTTIAGDSLIVTLYGYDTTNPDSLGFTFYDICKLEKLD